MEDIEDVVNLLKAIKEFRVNDELPFNNMQIDAAIEFLSRPTQCADGRLKLVRVYEESEVEEVSVGEYRLKNRQCKYPIQKQDTSKDE